MNDIFISYDSADRAIPLGKAFDQVIEEELNAARCVIVLWSKESVRSRWVKTEAAAAADRDCLLPVLIEDIAIPFEFKRIQTAMLINWSGDDSDPEFNRLVKAIEQLAKQPRALPPRPANQTNKPAAWRVPPGRWIIAAAVVLLFIAGALTVRNLPRQADPSPQQQVSS